MPTNAGTVTGVDGDRVFIRLDKGGNATMYKSVVRRTDQNLIERGRRIQCDMSQRGRVFEAILGGMADGYSSDGKSQSSTAARGIQEGTIHRVPIGRDFAFIRPNEGGSDVFVHFDEFSRAKEDPPCEGDRISYQVRTGNDGRESAWKVKVVRRADRFGSYF